MARGKFVDLGDAPPKFAETPKKYYPRACVRKKVRGLTRVGQKVRLSVQARVVSMRADADTAPEFELELRKIAVEGDDA